MCVLVCACVCACRCTCVCVHLCVLGERAKGRGYHSNRQMFCSLLCAWPHGLEHLSGLGVQILWPLISFMFFQTYG